MKHVEGCWYRYDEQRYYGPMDEDGYTVGEGSIRIHLHPFPVIKHTPCGVWLDMGRDEKRWVARSWQKRFACPTKREAAVSLMKRRESQISILTARLEDAEAVYNTIKDALTEGGETPLSHDITIPWRFR